MGNRSPRNWVPEVTRAVGFPRPIPHGLCADDMAGRPILRTPAVDEPSAHLPMLGTGARGSWLVSRGLLPEAPLRGPLGVRYAPVVLRRFRATESGGSTSGGVDETNEAPRSAGREVRGFRVGGRRPSGT